LIIKFLKGVFSKYLIPKKYQICYLAKISHLEMFLLSQENKSQQAENSSSTESSETEEDFQRIFVLPKKIKQAKIALSIAQGIMGVFLVVLPILYFVDPAERTVSLMIFAILGLVFGVVLVGLLPTNIAKAVNSKLILGQKSVSIRNSFGWKIFPWKDIEEILLTEKISSDPNNPKSIGISLIRFRTIAKNAYFMADSYPADEVRELKHSTKESFAVALLGTDYSVSEKTERPSVRSRFIYYYKATNKTNQITLSEKNKE